MFQLQAWPSPEIFAKILKGFTKTFVSSPQSWTNLASALHGFGSAPSAFGAYLVCIAPDATPGYAINDRLDPNTIFNNDSGVPACQLMANLTQLNLYTLDVTAAMSVTAKAGGAGAPAITPNDYLVVFWAIQF